MKMCQVFPLPSSHFIRNGLAQEGVQLPDVRVVLVNLVRMAEQVGEGPRPGQIGALLGQPGPVTGPGRLQAETGQQAAEIG